MQMNTELRNKLEALAALAIEVQQYVDAEGFELDARDARLVQPIYLVIEPIDGILRALHRKADRSMLGVYLRAIVRQCHRLLDEIPLFWRS